MGREIERKFLVNSEAWRAQVIGSVRLCDGILARSEGGKVRIRIAGDTASITVKGRRIGLTRSEFEYEIPVADAEDMLATLCQRSSIISKTRYYVPHDGLVWSVDFYGEPGTAGVTVAEIELHSETQTFKLPDWVGREVTWDPRYRIGNISRLLTPAVAIRVGA